MMTDECIKGLMWWRSVCRIRVISSFPLWISFQKWCCWDLKQVSAINMHYVLSLFGATWPPAPCLYNFFSGFELHWPYHGKLTIAHYWNAKFICEILRSDWTGPWSEIPILSFPLWAPLVYIGYVLVYSALVLYPATSRIKDAGKPTWLAGWSGLWASLSS